MVKTTAALSILANVIRPLVHSTRIQFVRKERLSRLSTREPVARLSNVSASQRPVLSLLIHALSDSSEFQSLDALAAQNTNAFVIRLCAHQSNDQHAMSENHLQLSILLLVVSSTSVLATLRTAQPLLSVPTDIL